MVAPARVPLADRPVEYLAFLNFKNSEILRDALSELALTESGSVGIVPLRVTLLRKKVKVATARREKIGKALGARKTPATAETDPTLVSVHPLPNLQGATDVPISLEEATQEPLSIRTRASRLCLPGQ